LVVIQYIEGSQIIDNEVEDYWTDERIASAIPMGPIMIDVNGNITDKAPPPLPTCLALSTVLPVKHSDCADPWYYEEENRVIGKVFFYKSARWFKLCL
jgi:hypothetical protein